MKKQLIKYIMSSALALGLFNLAACAKRDSEPVTDSKKRVAEHEQKLKNIGCHFEYNKKSAENQLNCSDVKDIKEAQKSLEQWRADAIKLFNNNSLTENQKQNLRQNIELVGLELAHIRSKLVEASERPKSETSIDIKKEVKAEPKPNKMAEVVAPKNEKAQVAPQEKIDPASLIIDPVIKAKNNIDVAIENLKTIGYTDYYWVSSSEIKKMSYEEADRRGLNKDANMLAIKVSALKVLKYDTDKALAQMTSDQDKKAIYSVRNKYIDLIEQLETDILMDREWAVDKVLNMASLFVNDNFLEKTKQFFGRSYFTRENILSEEADVTTEFLNKIEHAADGKGNTNLKRAYLYELQAHLVTSDVVVNTWDATLTEAIKDAEQINKTIAPLVREDMVFDGSDEVIILNRVKKAVNTAAKSLELKIAEETRIFNEEQVK